MNTGNTVPGGLLSNLNTQIPFGRNSMQTSTPAALPQQTGWGEMTGQKPVLPATSSPGITFNSTPLISSVNPQINPTHSAILAAHDSTVKALNKPPATTNTSLPIQGDPLLNKPGTMTPTPGYTPVATGAPTGPGSSIPGAAPTTFGGLLGGAMTQAQKYEAQQAGLTSEAQQAINKFSGLEGSLANEPLAGGANGIGSARMAQLESLKQNTVGAIESEQAKLAGYQTPISSLYGTEIGATQPSGHFPFAFNPATGTFSDAAPGASGDASGGVQFTGNPATDAATAAQAVVSGKMTYAQAQSSMSYAGSAADNYLNSAIINAGGDPLKLQASGAATQSNIQTGGTAATTAAASGLQNATQNYVAANTAYSTTQQQSANLKDTMSATGINDVNSQFYNSAINSLQNQFGSAKYTSFITALNETKQAYTNLLSSVGAATPTVNGQQATDIFNAASTPAQINAAIDALNQAAYAKLQPMYQQIGTYASQLNSGNSNTSTNTGSGAFSDSSFYGKS